MEELPSVAGYIPTPWSRGSRPMQHSRRSGSWSSCQPSGSRCRHHAAQPSAHAPGFILIVLVHAAHPTPTASGGVYSIDTLFIVAHPHAPASGSRHPFGRRSLMVGRHQDTVETVAAVIPTPWKIISRSRDCFILEIQPLKISQKFHKYFTRNWNNCLIFKE